MKMVCTGYFLNGCLKYMKTWTCQSGATLVTLAWRTATLEDQMFLAFCKSFVEVSGEPTKSETEYWDAALAAEARIRAYLVENEIQIMKQEDFDLSVIADGFLAGRRRSIHCRLIMEFRCAARHSMQTQRAKREEISKSTQNF